MDRALNSFLRWKAPGCLAALVMILYSPASIFAFSPESRVTITSNAFKLMPPSLRTQLEKHKKDCLLGALEPMLHEGEQKHNPAMSGEVVAEKIARQAQVVVNMINNHEPFKKIVHEMGILSHYVTDLNFPLTLNGEGKEYYDAFAKFCQNKEDKIQFVFYGFHNPHLSRNDLHAFSDEVFQRSASHIPFVQQAYSRAQQGIQGEFDDRSILFGIAAISYSHAITDIARIWLYVWDQAHGDITGTPHLETFKKKE